MASEFYSDRSPTFVYVDTRLVSHNARAFQISGVCASYPTGRGFRVLEKYQSLKVGVSMSCSFIYLIFFYKVHRSSCHPLLLETLRKKSTVSLRQIPKTSNNSVSFTIRMGPSRTMILLFNISQSLTKLVSLSRSCPNVVSADIVVVDPPKVGIFLVMPMWLVKNTTKLTKLTDKLSTGPAQPSGGPPQHLPKQ